METNGQLSVLKKTTVSPVTPNQLGLHVTLESMPSLLIADGEILYENSKAVGKNENWLLAELRMKGYKSAADVFIAQIASAGKLFVDGYQDD